MTSAVTDTPMTQKVKRRPANSRVCVELRAEFVPVPPERLEVWRAGIANWFDYIDELILQDEANKLQNEKQER